jgi:hypothetical protein
MVSHQAQLLRTRDEVVETAPPTKSDRYLILFSGAKSQGRLADQIRLKDDDAIVEEYDILNDTHQDLCDLELQLRILGRILEGEFKAVHIALPMGSYMVVDGPQIRSKANVQGLRHLPPRLVKYLQKHNSLTEFAALAATTAESSDTLWSILGTAEHDVESSPAYSKEHADWAQLWHQPAIINLIETGATKILVPLCKCGSPFGVHVDVLVSAKMPSLWIDSQLVCEHVLHEHLELEADVRGIDHEPRASFIPIGLNVLLARALCLMRHHAAEELGVASLADGACATEADAMTLGDDLGELIDAPEALLRGGKLAARPRLCTGDAELAADLVDGGRAAAPPFLIGVAD